MQHADIRRRSLRPVSGLLSRLVAVFEGIAFWTAATFPFAHVGALLLYANGALSGTAIVGLVAVHVTAILAGHRHNQTDGDRHE